MHRAVRPRLPGRRRRVRDAALVRRPAVRARRASGPAGGRLSHDGHRDARRAPSSTSAAHAVVEANGLRDARMRITVTSGPGPPGPGARRRPADRARRRVAADAVAADLDRRDVARCGATSTARWPASRRCRWRESVTALAEARAAGADEALVLNTRGDLCEATTANVFLVHDGVAATPPVEAGCLAGITREHVLELGAVERRLSSDDVGTAEEAFLTSSTREVQPLVAVDGRRDRRRQAGPGDGAPRRGLLAAGARDAQQVEHAHGSARDRPRRQAGAEPLHPAGARARRRPAAVRRRARLRRAQAPHGRVGVLGRRGVRAVRERRCPLRRDREPALAAVARRAADGPHRLVRRRAGRVAAGAARCSPRPRTGSAGAG